LDYYNKVNDDSLELACLVLIRNDIANNNPNVTAAIENTLFDRGAVFDKILVTMLKNCVKELDRTLINPVLIKLKMLDTFYR
jgi:hypothetical protein